MSEMVVKKNEVASCWCSGKLVSFSETHLICDFCQTLVSKNNEKNDEFCFKNNLGFSLEQTANCLTILSKYCAPPADVWDFGGIQNEFSTLMRSIRYNVAHSEAEKLFDTIALINILEYSLNPEIVIQRCLKVLKPSGFLLVQTSNHSKSQRLSASKTKKPFYVFNTASIQLFLQKFGFNHFEFEYSGIEKSDMLFVASRMSLVPHTDKIIEKTLNHSMEGRILAALLTKEKQYEQSEKESSTRLAKLEVLTKELEESEADRALRLGQVETLVKQNKDLEVNCVSRLDQIEKLTAFLKDSESDRLARAKQIETLTELLKNSEVDRSARLLQIGELSTRLIESEERKKRGLQGTVWRTL